MGRAIVHSWRTATRMPLQLGQGKTHQKRLKTYFNLDPQKENWCGMWGPQQWIPGGRQCNESVWEQVSNGKGEGKQGQQ